MKDILAHFFEPFLLDEILLQRRVHMMRWVITFNLIVCILVGGYYTANGIYPPRVTVIFILWAVALLMAFLLLHCGDVTLAGNYFILVDLKKQILRCIRPRIQGEYMHRSSSAL